MSEVTLTVGGRHYAVSCEAGQEEHVRRLAGMVDARLASVGAAAVTNDAKNMLFAALILADELEEARRGIAPPEVPAGDTRAAQILESVAQALEKTANALERGQTNA